MFPSLYLLSNTVTTLYQCPISLFLGSLFRFLLSASPSHPSLSFSHSLCHSQKRTHFLSMLLSSLIYSGGERRGQRHGYLASCHLITPPIDSGAPPRPLPLFPPLLRPSFTTSPPLLSPQQSTSHYAAETVCSVVWILSTISHRRRHTYSKKRGYRTIFLIENVGIYYIV